MTVERKEYIWFQIALVEFAVLFCVETYLLSKLMHLAISLAISLLTIAGFVWIYHCGKKGQFALGVLFSALWVILSISSNLDFIWILFLSLIGVFLNMYTFTHLKDAVTMPTNIDIKK